MEQSEEQNPPPIPSEILQAMDVEGSQEELEQHEEDKAMDEVHAMKEEQNNGADLNDAPAAGQDAPVEEPAAVDPAAEQRRVEEAAKKYLAEQTHEVVIPSYAGWFDMTTIDPLEKKSLPEFFNGRNRSKTPTVYKDYRDFMINTYRLNPEEYLTFTACRRNLAGDVCAIMRVHAFLEQWGLINYQVDADTRASIIGPPFTGHFRVTADTPRGLQPFQPGMSTVTSGKPSAATQEKARKETGESNMELRKNIYESSPGGGALRDANASAAPTGPQKHYNCFTCGTECTLLRYHNTKRKSELCVTCYEDSRFPSTTHSGDFVKIDLRGQKPGDDWTDQETLLLLEGVEMFEEDWDAIADHVGTRTREACVLKFIQLPIEDPYLEGAPQPVITGGKRLPFSQADNPVMSVVAFLASVVEPTVAAKAAERSVGALRETLKKQAEEKKKENDVKAEEAKDGEKAPASDEEMADAPAPAPAVEQPSQDGAVDKETLEKAAEIALGSAAAKAHLLASHSELEMQRLTTALTHAQLSKLELKLAQFTQLERVLDRERAELEKQREEIYLERLSMKKQVFAVQEQLRKGMEIGAVNPKEGFAAAVQAGGMGGEGVPVQMGAGNSARFPGVGPISAEKPGQYVPMQM
ncbi:SWI/SNF and RSC complex subunit Ssr2 [Saitoella coloradoensis]